MTNEIKNTEQIKGSVAKLSKIFEHRTRLAICVLLMSYERISFRRFKELLAESDGSLGAQLRKLEDEKCISIHKEFENRRPISWYSITSKGRAALNDHISAVETLLDIVPEKKEAKND